MFPWRQKRSTMGTHWWGMGEPCLMPCPSRPSADRPWALGSPRHSGAGHDALAICDSWCRLTPRPVPKPNLWASREFAAVQAGLRHVVLGRRGTFRNPTGMEFLVIDGETDLRRFRSELRLCVG